MRKVPVILSNIPILREVGQDYSQYVDNNKPKDLVSYINELINDTNQYDRIKRKLDQYEPCTWDKCVEEMLKGLKRFFINDRYI